MNLQNLALFIPLLLVAMTVHEASHALMSNWLGDHTAKHEGRLSLNPFVHIDPIFTVLVPAVFIALGMPPILAAKPVPFNPYALRYGEFGAALVALAGPLSNLVLAAISAVLFRFVSAGFLYEVLTNFLLLNISLAVFNLVPWPPLDGSRVLYAFAPDVVKRVMDQIESLGIIGLLIVIMFGFRFIGPAINNISDALTSAFL